jgi:uncharacterized alpha/beta hydrolase family protein
MKEYLITIINLVICLLIIGIVVGYLMVADDEKTFQISPTNIVIE